jgi:O-antigen ligase
VKRENNFLLTILGIFFMAWSTSAYFLFGASAKLTALFIGFSMIVYSCTKFDVLRKWGGHLFIQAIFFLLLIALAIINDQETLDRIDIIFAAICFFMFTSGFLLKKNKSFLTQTLQLNVVIYLIIYAGCLFSAFIFYQKQSVLFSESILGVRDLGDESLNPVGVAYNHALLFILVTWSLSANQKKWLFLLGLSAATSTLLVVSLTLSRGAVTYLILLGLLLVLRFVISKGVIKIFYWGVILISISLGMLNYLSTNNLIEAKWNSLEARFDRVGQSSDESINKRADFYGSFSDNVLDYSFGQYNYRPYPHNQFLEIIMRWGLFGLPLLIISLLSLYKSLNWIILNHSENLNTIHGLIILLFLFCFFQSMTSLSLEMNRFLWFGFGYFWSGNIKLN